MSRLVANNMTGTFDDMATAFNREQSVTHAEKAAPGMLMMLDGFIESSPSNEDLLLMAAEMNCSFAMAVVEPKDEAWAMALYDKGRGYAERALSEQQSDIHTAVVDGNVEAVKEALAAAKKDHAQALYWLSMCWGSWINLNQEDMEVVADMPKIEAIAVRVLALDPTYFNAGADLLLGVYYSSRPKALGGDPEKGKEHFEACLEKTDNTFLLAHVLYAEKCAVALQDRALFVALLEEVIAAPEDIDPANGLVTMVAKERAEDLLDGVDDLFLGVGSAPPPKKDEVEDDLLEELDDL